MSRKCRKQTIEVCAHEEEVVELECCKSVQLERCLVVDKGFQVTRFSSQHSYAVNPHATPATCPVTHSSFPQSFCPPQK